ncbi:E3 UFM1-protein ligase 1 homolog [Neocloeon triangulifer]|uniref:E3 UFM1-protein ligase 1 homolog n=1 Tax=Neocloeon triangulifer TaxID=2078957 RepID=UPI00286EEF32|nr:E3 UFM1-protein ligase 1 homolog [Neocloeon triangulifer]
MSAVDWDEVKRLAADFQKAQLSTAAQKLSERNCVIVVSHLIKEKLLEVISTSDGKEYVTPQHLSREIQDELYASKGRINMVELANLLNVDLTHIEARCQELVRSPETGCTLVLGQLIHSSYLKNLAIQINETLQMNGTLNISTLTTQYDLPGDYLQHLVEKELNRSIHGQQDPKDPRVFFTERFVARCRAAIRGALIGIQQPTPISNIMAICGVSERMFFSIFESLKDSKQIAGVMSGKQGSNAFFVPAVYSKGQSEWVENFYKQNGYLEYSSLNRLGISDPQGFIKRHFANEKLLQLPSCAVGSLLFDQVEASIEDAVSTGSWIDLMPILPSVLSEQDAAQLVQDVLKKIKQVKAEVFCGSMVVPGQLISNLTQALDPLIQAKAQEAVSSGKFVQAEVEQRIQAMGRQKASIDDEGGRTSKQEERRKKATGGKGGGGTQGRETKTKSIKKKTYGKSHADSDEDGDETPPPIAKKTGLIELVSVKDIKKELSSQASLSDCPEELIAELSARLLPSVQQQANTVARKLSESVKATQVQSSRRTHGELQERLSNLLSSIRMFEKGIKFFQTDSETQKGLTKYMLKSLGSEILGELLKYVSQENQISTTVPNEASSITPELRTKILNELPAAMKQVLEPVHKSLVGTSLDDFQTAIDAALAPGACDVMIRKPDKKKERQGLLAHRMTLLGQLDECSDPALALHLTVLLLFQAATQQPLHASGKFVMPILIFLKPSLPEEIYSTLQKYHDLVINLLSTDNDDEKEQVNANLAADLATLKEIAHTLKKLPVSDKGEKSEP